MNKKYSIIIPTHNAIQYLPTCINTIINQDYEDYELIISDDNSTDGTSEYLSNIVHRNVKIIRPKERLTMVEHFEWALKFATGEWVMFLGSDDGLQSYFFELADVLTEKANKKNIRTIMSQRAYYFWPESELLYGENLLSFTAMKQVKILKTKYEIFSTLMGFQNYFELPEMYGTSIFNKGIIEEALKLQNGRLFTTIPPDANLGAIACCLEKKYLKSFIPLGWVGTSSSRVVSTIKPNVINTKLPRQGQGVGYDYYSGDFLLGSSAIYFWNALKISKCIDKNKKIKFLNGKILLYLIFAGVRAEIYMSRKRISLNRIDLLKDLAKRNNCNNYVINALAPFLYILYIQVITSKKISNRVSMFFVKTFKIKLFRDSDKEIELNKISKQIHNSLNKLNIL